MLDIHSDYNTSNYSKVSMSKFGLLLLFLSSSMTIGSVMLPAHSQGIPSAKQPIVMPNSALPKKLAEKLIQQVSRETKTPIANLKITEVKALKFGACRNIHQGPNPPCSNDRSPGWKAIVISPSQTFVYYLNADANQIAQNLIASGATRGIRVSLESFGWTGAIGPVVFQSSSVRGMSVVRTVLTEDGKITRYQYPAKITPVLIRTLSPSQLKALKKALENQYFPYFNGLSYLPVEASIDSSLTTYQGLFSSVRFIDAQKKELPKSLQQVIQNWESLTLSNRPIAQDETNPKVAKLQQFLKAKQWAKADQETRLLISDLSKVPNSLIQAIDRVWLNESDNRFGLSVQAKIWRESMAKSPKDSQKATNIFRERVGWNLTYFREQSDVISSAWLNESELNYSAQAPIGHFPWAGVSDAEVAKLMAGVVDGCGSCTTDAMQLRNERFYSYLPQLFDRVRIAIRPF